jgi:outer membrane protein TolC
MSSSRVLEQGVVARHNRPATAGSPEGLRYVLWGLPCVTHTAMAVAQPFRAAVIGITMLVAAQPFRAAVIAQTPVPIERVTFDDAIQRAIKNNPSAAIAAAGILRAEALLMEARSASRLQVNGNITTTTLNRGVDFDGATVTPRNQLAASLDVRMPLFAPARWARTAQADEARHVAEASAEDVRRQTAIATADAYLTIIARRRVVEGNTRARESAKAHYELARELRQGGTGSRLNELRAQQELSADETLVEAAQLAVYQAEEALGVLLVADGPVDVIDTPAFAMPPDIAAVAAPAPEAGGTPGTIQADLSRSLLERSDLKLFAAEQQLAEHVLRDSSKDRFPFLEAVFQPSTSYPSQLFFPQSRWQFLLQLSVPLFDSGQRQGQKLERQAALDVSRATFARALTTASSEVRAARESIASSERFLASARAGADQAQQVVNIVNVSFRAGAATNIEVIDAERRARDSDTAVAIAEDSLRRARLDLLTAVGRFP